MVYSQVILMHTVKLMMLCKVEGQRSKERGRLRVALAFGELDSVRAVLVPLRVVQLSTGYCTMKAEARLYPTRVPH